MGLSRGAVMVLYQFTHTVVDKSNSWCKNVRASVSCVLSRNMEK